MSFRDLIPKPDLTRAETLLVVSPHPDDAVIGAGATLARLAVEGKRILVANLTSGEAGTLDATLSAKDLADRRELEERRAEAVLGVSEVLFLGLPDFGGMTPEEVQNALLPVIRKSRPDILLAPDPYLPYESHPDHRAAGLGAAQAVLAAAFPKIRPEAGPPCPSPAIAFYATANPNTFVPADTYWAKKAEALRCHESQFPPSYLDLLLGYLEERARAYPGEAGPKEAFRVLHPLYLHMNVDAGDTAG